MSLYKTYYDSPIGKLLLVSDDTNLMGLWIENQKYYLGNLKENLIEKDDLPILMQTKNWLDRYFKCEKPKFNELSLKPVGSEFRKLVWQILCDIPYGKTRTYGELAHEVASRLHKNSMSAQAIGGAVSHNPISIIIPCHRVIGSNGSFTGYAGGMERKKKLLELEGVKI